MVTLLVSLPYLVVKLIQNDESSTFPAPKFQTEQITYEKMRSYQMSVIEREVKAGILDVEATKSSSLAFLREIKNVVISDNKSCANTAPCFSLLNSRNLFFSFLVGDGRKALHYIDVRDDGKWDRESERLASELREVKIPEKLERSNWRAFEVEWAGIAGQRSDDKAQFSSLF